MQTVIPPRNVMPRELSKAVLPTYTIEPPDVLSIDVINYVPRHPYRLRPHDEVAIKVQRGLNDPVKQGDVLSIQVQGLPMHAPDRPLQPGDIVAVSVPDMPDEAPIDAQFRISGDGTIDLLVPEYEKTVEIGPDGTPVEKEEYAGTKDYGRPRLGDLRVEDARTAIVDHLRKGTATEPGYNVTTAFVTLANEPVPIEGDFTVVQSGHVTLPFPYGPIQVAGKDPRTNEDIDMHIREVESKILETVSQFLSSPSVHVVLAESAATPIDALYPVQIDGTVNPNIPVRWSR
ncbi:MAG: polysaccharide biosynthesis/export family protein, partial [Planctomycetota bacterium]